MVSFIVSQEIRRGDVGVVHKIFRPSRISRRQFLQGLGLKVGVTLVGGIALSAACKTSTEISTIQTQPSTTPASSTTTYSTAVTNVVTTPSVSTPPTTSVKPTSTPATTASTIPFAYTPIRPDLIQIIGSTCTVATDRFYSLEHIWVKSISSGLAVLGITPTFVAILYEPYTLSLPKMGERILQDDGFGTIQGWKTAADLIAPVTGKVVGLNETLANIGQMTGQIALLTGSEPFINGWMVAVQMDKPDQLKALLTPEDYIERLGKSQSVTPVPAD